MMTYMTITNINLRSHICTSSNKIQVVSPSLSVSVSVSVSLAVFFLSSRDLVEKLNGCKDLDLATFYDPTI